MGEQPVPEELIFIHWGGEGEEIFVAGFRSAHGNCWKGWELRR